MARIKKNKVVKEIIKLKFIRETIEMPLRIQTVLKLNQDTPFLCSTGYFVAREVCVQTVINQDPSLKTEKKLPLATALWIVDKKGELDYRDIYDPNNKKRYLMWANNVQEALENHESMVKTIMTKF